MSPFKEKGEIMVARLIVAILCTAFVATGVSAGTTANHTVTVTVAAINEVAIVGGNVTLTIDSATAGSQPDDATDATTSDLNWTTNEASKKITVATDLADPDFTLKVVAANVAGGTAAAQVTLSTIAADFVTGISTTVGTCDLSYTASATAAQGTGSDVHTVTYTITAES
ncbi:MAG: hypothetical protein KJ927_08445 [Candidatus Eisenbacteria bacterium]|nr:hypothetical protein [Candidatus Eisenbacteria bacterium]